MKPSNDLTTSSLVQENILEVGDKAPDFQLMMDMGDTFHLYHYLKTLEGKPLVLYFYPKDMTPGCTQQACDFRDAQTDQNLHIVGISKDSRVSHKKFKEKYALTFPLLVDTDGAVSQKYGVWRKKSMYGREYFGIERSTFLINEQGLILKIWRKVSVSDHVSDVLQQTIAFL